LVWCSEVGLSRVSISPRDFDGALFDLDGVITATASVHRGAWRALFDPFLRDWASRHGQAFQPFTDSDYLAYVDGLPRSDGVRTFLASRGITLPEDGAPSVRSLAESKDLAFRERLAHDGVTVLPGALEALVALRAAGVRTAVVSSSRNCAFVVATAGLDSLFDVRVDGTHRAALRLPGKPAPDMFLEAARRLGVEPSRALVAEDAIVGVQAGRAGGFRLVIGVDRGGQAAALEANGADIVMEDLSSLEVEGVEPSHTDTLPRAVDSLDAIAQRVRGRQLAVFLDYDGTLTPIVERPEDAVLSDGMRHSLNKLAAACTVAIVSGRDLADVRALVGVSDLIYAGSHGFDIVGPGGLALEKGVDWLPALDEAERRLNERLAGVAGAQVERKRFAIAVHWRRVADAEVPEVERAVDQVLAASPQLRKTGGKRIFELRPDVPWDKGKAVRHVMTALGLDRSDVVPVYIGDDETDEDAFAALRGRGISFLVRDEPRATLADYVIDGTDEVRRVLAALREMAS
jgi:alpha,alpha-trehalase